MKVVFSARAKNDLAEFAKFIARDKPQAARKWASGIRESVLALADFPRLGRTVPEFGDSTIREILKGQFRIVYTIDEENGVIVIITIHHAKIPLP